MPPNQHRNFLDRVKSRPPDGTSLVCRTELKRTRSPEASPGRRDLLGYRVARDAGFNRGRLDGAATAWPTPAAVG